MMEPEDLPIGVDPKSMGLYPKYDVINRVSGELVTDPVFVLKPGTDKHAREALRRYAVSCFEDGYEALAQDIYAWLMALDAADIAIERTNREIAKSDTVSTLRNVAEALRGAAAERAEASLKDSEIDHYDGFGAPVLKEQFADPVTDDRVTIGPKNGDRNMCGFCSEGIHYWVHEVQGAGVDEVLDEGWAHDVAGDRDHDATPANLSSS